MSIPGTPVPEPPPPPEPAQHCTSEGPGQRPEVNVPEQEAEVGSQTPAPAGALQVATQHWMLDAPGQ
jgi:hypothetical protein